MQNIKNKTDIKATRLQPLSKHYNEKHLCLGEEVPEN